MAITHPTVFLVPFAESIFLSPGSSCLSENFLWEGSRRRTSLPLDCFSKYNGSPYIMALPAPPANTMAMNTGMMYQAAP